MRKVFIILALALAVLLHVCIWTGSTAAPSPEEQGRTPGVVHGAVFMLANISPSMQGDRITVIGRISDIWEPAGKRAPHTIILRDGSAALEVVHWLKSAPCVDIGDSVECTGTVDLYRGGLQLRLWASRDLQVLNP